MSKAFTRESEDSSDDGFVPPPQLKLPPGVKNYMTQRGADRLREELDRLRTERSAIAPQSSDETGKRRISAIDARLVHLDESLRTAVIVAAPPVPHEQVRFGATVKVRE